MELEQILIRKDEIPVIEHPPLDKYSFKRPFFSLPIHPKLLDESLTFEKRLANRLFPQAVDDWYEDLDKYTESQEYGSYKKWMYEVFLKEKPHVKEEHGIQVIYPNGTWKDRVIFRENGLAYGFELNRDAGGTIYIPWNEHERVQHIGPRTVKFGPEKFLEYRVDGEENIFDSDTRSGVYANVFSFHNVDHYPGALLLRNWAIMYLNESLKKIIK